MAHAQKPDFVFRLNGRVHLNRQGASRQFSRLLAAEVCASAVVMLDTPCSEVAWRVLATRSIRQVLLRFPSRASPCAITFQLDSTSLVEWSAQRRGPYRTPYNTPKRLTFMSPAGFELATPASERPQTHALYRAATWIGKSNYSYCRLQMNNLQNCTYYISRKGSKLYF